MTMFSQKERFDLTDFLSRPATAAEIKRASDARRKHKEFMERIESERAILSARKKS